MKQVIITRTATVGGILSVQAVLWYPVPLGREVPRPDVQNSAYRQATQAELDAIKAGRVLEEADTYRFPKSLTSVQIKSFLVSVWTDRKAFLDTNPLEGQYYGTFYDGTIWSA